MLSWEIYKKPVTSGSPDDSPFSAVRIRISADGCCPPVQQASACVVIEAITRMPSALTTLRRRAKALHRNLRGDKMAASALISTDHSLLAHIIPMRRCNLACTYCNEFDDFSKPVP